MPPSYLFQPIAFETLGAINNYGISFIHAIGRRLSQSSAERRATEFFFQRLSVSLQRFNAVAFRGCFNAFLDSDKFVIPAMFLV